MLLGLRTAIYPVTDLAAAKAWYSKVLDAEPYFDEPFYVGFSVGGFELGLIPDAPPGRAARNLSGAWPPLSQPTPACWSWARWPLNQSPKSAAASK